VLRPLALLANRKASYEGDDEIPWPHGSNGQFSVESYCMEMYKGSTTIDFPAKAIWESKAPTKACFLVLATMKGKVPKGMLKRKNFKLASRCPMCLGRKNGRAPFGPLPMGLHFVHLSLYLIRFSWV